MEPILNSQLPEFSVQAFHNGAFKPVTNNDLKGKWAILFFYPADFTFVCPCLLYTSIFARLVWQSGRLISKLHRSYVYSCKLLPGSC